MTAGEAGTEQDHVEQSDPETEATDAERRKAMTSDDFLVPGPSPGSNEGLGRWGLSWLMFSVALIIMMAVMSYVCLIVARWTGFA